MDLEGDALKRDIIMSDFEGEGLQGDNISS
jgi:hypothetical protein